MNLIKLKNEAREIRDNWESIELLESQLVDKGGELWREMALQGKRLKEVQTQLKPNEWQQWLDLNVGGHNDRARRCLRVFEKSASGEVKGALQQLLGFFKEDEATTHKQGEPKHWPAGIEGNLRLSKWVGFVERYPIEKWPEESKEAAREKLLPFVKQLWPSASL